MLEDLINEVQSERNEFIDAQADACIEASKEIEQVVYNLKKFLGSYLLEDIGWVQTNCTDLDDFQPWTGQMPENVSFRMSTVAFEITGRVIIDVHRSHTFLKKEKCGTTSQVGNEYICNAINNIGDCAKGLAKLICPWEMDPKKLTQYGKQYPARKSLDI